MTNISKSCFRQDTCLTKVADITQFDLVSSRTFKGLNLPEKNLSTLKDFQGDVGTLHLSNTGVEVNWNAVPGSRNF